MLERFTDEKVLYLLVTLPELFALRAGLAFAMVASTALASGFARESMFFCKEVAS